MSRWTAYALHWLRMAYGACCYVAITRVPHYVDRPLAKHALAWAGYYAYQPVPWWRPIERASRGRGD